MIPLWAKIVILLLLGGGIFGAGYGCRATSDAGALASKDTELKQCRDANAAFVKSEQALRKKGEETQADLDKARVTIGDLGADLHQRELERRRPAPGADCPTRERFMMEEAAKIAARHQRSAP